MLKIVGIKTKKGYYVTDNIKNDSYFNTKLKSYFINGENPTPTFHKDWVFVNEYPATIEQLKSQPSINHRYELIDTTLESEKFPKVLIRDEVAVYDSEDYEWIWKSEYRHLQSLYQLKCDTQPDIKVPVEFEYTTILELDEIKEFNGFAYPIQRTQWSHEGLTNLTEKDVQYQLLDRILFPSIVLPSRPCKLTSEQAYKIVRQYIKQHINYEVAEITSDYNFCFEVAKKIKLAEPYTRENEITKSNGKSYRPPRYNRKYVITRIVPIFEMTYSPENYKGYTPIPEFYGEDQEDLKNNIDRYCKELIEAINKPLEDCPCCKGHGVIVQEKIDAYDKK